MPPRISYFFLEPYAVEIVVKALTEELYPQYESSRVAFILQGKEGEALLESALAMPRQPYYKGTLGKAAALLRSLVKNHPFIDGNKRFALALTTLFLGANGYIFLSTKEEIVSFVLRVAQEDAPSPSSIERWLRKFCLYWRTKKRARRRGKLTKMAAGYPGGVSALNSALADYVKMLTAVKSSLDRRRDQIRKQVKVIRKQMKKRAPSTPPIVKRKNTVPVRGN